MIAGIFFEGSGLGDQLFRYITVRTLAEKKGFEWGILNPNSFKGDGFLNIEKGKEVPNDFYELKMGMGSFAPHPKAWNEKEVRDANGVDIRSYDPEINFVEDNTIIDGSFEDSKYWRHNLSNISKWLSVEPLNVPNDLCVVGFRGGEYASQPDLFLTDDYWMHAFKMLKDLHLHPQVHTDDPILAKQKWPGFEIIDNEQINHSKHSNMGFNWRSARYAKYAIIPNSAFFILPRLLKHFEDPSAITIAPRYWARRNTKTWARPACYYPEFTYL